MGILEKLHEMKNVNENPRLGRWETLDNIMEVLPGKGEQGKYEVKVFINHLWPLGSFLWVKT